MDLEHDKLAMEQPEVNMDKSNVSEEADHASRKKTHRRKPGGKRKKEKRTTKDLLDDDDLSSKEAGSEEVFSDPEVPYQPPLRKLRPTVVPKAPQNSTQFIIDDHENCDQFISFEHDGALKLTPPNPTLVAEGEVSMSGDPEPSLSMTYLQNDFENVYSTARHDEVLDWPAELLVEKIASLEDRVKYLEQQVELYDPLTYMDRLQQRLLLLQEENKRLKEISTRCPIHGRRKRHSRPPTTKNSPANYETYKSPTYSLSPAVVTLAHSPHVNPNNSPSSLKITKEIQGV